MGLKEFFKHDKKELPVTTVTSNISAFEGENQQLNLDVVQSQDYDIQEVGEDITENDSLPY